MTQTEDKNPHRLITFGLGLLTIIVVLNLYFTYQVFNKVNDGGFTKLAAVVPTAQPAKVDIKVTDEDPSKGPKEAKVTIV